MGPENVQQLTRPAVPQHTRTRMHILARNRTTYGARRTTHAQCTQNKLRLHRWQTARAHRHCDRIQSLALRLGRRHPATVGCGQAARRGHSRDEHDRFYAPRQESTRRRRRHYLRTRHRRRWYACVLLSGRLAHMQALSTARARARFDVHARAAKKRAACRGVACSHVLRRQWGCVCARARVAVAGPLPCARVGLQATRATPPRRFSSRRSSTCAETPRLSTATESK